MLAYGHLCHCISAFVVVCGRCIVHRLCSTTCKLPCLATLCDRYQASLLEASKGGALNRCPQRAKSLRQNDLLKGLGELFSRRKVPLNCIINAIVSLEMCQWHISRRTNNRKKLLSPIMRTSRTRISNRKKLLTTVQRSECVYKRAAERSDTFCGEEKQWSGWLIFYRVKNRNKRNSFRRERVELVLTKVIGGRKTGGENSPQFFCLLFPHRRWKIFIFLFFWYSGQVAKNAKSW